MLNIIVSPVFAIFGFMLKTWCACVCVCGRDHERVILCYTVCISVIWWIYLVSVI